MSEKWEIGNREEFFQRKESVFKNFDLKNWCENEIEDNNEKYAPD